jgi:spore maturation protein CgeB
MNIVLFCHSLRSDWNHGNAHFLRGIVTELLRRGNSVRVFEPADGWSALNLALEAGDSALDAYRAHYPALAPELYLLESLDLERALDGADLVIVHEWSAPELVRRIGEHRRRQGSYRLLFHDTHHRLLTAPDEIRAFELSDYDAVLAFGEVLRERYAALGWGARAFSWHEAADTQVFRPRPRRARAGALVWVGNFGDGERQRELGEFLLEPVRSLALPARVYGVRYPSDARAALEQAGVEYAGWLPNFEVPAMFADFDLTVHVPRGPYAAVLHGIPTIRPFEALACGIPLLSAPWHDSEHLFTPGEDYLVASDGAEMTRLLRALVYDADQRQALARHGLATIQARHTCVHRVDELLAISARLGKSTSGRALPGWGTSLSAKPPVESCPS